MGYLYPAFFSEDFWQIFKKELMSWLDTPYKTLQKAKGYGADCTTFIGEAYKNVGILSKTQYPKTRHSNWMRDEQDFILTTLFYNFEKFAAKDIFWTFITHPGGKFHYVRGDLLMFKFKPGYTSYQHSTVYLGDRLMLHTAERSFVRLVEFDKRWQKRCKGIFRIKKASK